MAAKKDIAVTRIYQLEQGVYADNTYVVIDDGVRNHKLKKLPLSQIKGQKGDKGDPGFSPDVNIRYIEPTPDVPQGYEITITDAGHPEGQSFELHDGRSLFADWRIAYSSSNAVYIDDGYFDLNTNLQSSEGNSTDIYLQDSKLLFNRGIYAISVSLSVGNSTIDSAYKNIAVKYSSGLYGISWLHDWSVDGNVEQRTFSFILNVPYDGYLLNLTVEGFNDDEGYSRICYISCYKLAGSLKVCDVDITTDSSLRGNGSVGNPLGVNIATIEL